VFPLSTVRTPKKCFIPKIIIITVKSILRCMQRLTVTLPLESRKLGTTIGKSILLSIGSDMENRGCLTVQLCPFTMRGSSPDFQRPSSLRRQWKIIKLSLKTCSGNLRILDKANHPFKMSMHLELKT
jgi:hypothetical protein